MIKFIKKIMMVVLGSFLMSIGITFYLRAGLGVDPLAAFTTGIGSIIDVTYGQATYLIMGTIVIILLFIDRARVGIGTILNAFCIGLFTDFLLSSIVVEPQEIWIRLLILLFGSGLIGIGITVYILGGLGEGAVDAVMMLVNNRTKYNLKRVRIVMDSILLSLGGILGAKLGIGTIIGMVLVGPIVEWSMKCLSPLINTFLIDAKSHMSREVTNEV